MPRVIIIEDDELLGPAMQMMLEMQHDVSLREQPPPVTELAERNPDVMIIDYNAMGGNALRFVQQVRAHPALEGVRIVFTSGNHEIFDDNPEIAKLSTAFLKKPFTIDELTGTVDRVMKA